MLKEDRDGGGRGSCLCGGLLAETQYQSSELEETFTVAARLFSVETVSWEDALIYGQYT